MWGFTGRARAQSATELVPRHLFFVRPDYNSVHLSPDGSMGAWLTDRAGRSETSADFTAFDAVTVQVPHHPGTRFTIALPEKTDLRGIAWETTTDLLLTVFDDLEGNKQHLVRCRVTQRQCEVAPTP